MEQLIKVDERTAPDFTESKQIPVSPEITLQPAMTQKEQDLFRCFLRCSKNYLEFGTGGSTVMATANVSNFVISVDSSEVWLAKVAQSCAAARAGIIPLLVHADIGPVRALGYPLDDTFKAKWPQYVSTVWNIPQAAISDLCLIDGRFRVACFLSILLHCSPQTIIMFHDFPERKHYHIVRQFADEIATTDSLVAFRRKTDFRGDLALSVMEEQKFHPA
jgi:hypothetical protein